MRSFYLPAAFCALALFGAGCGDAPPPSNTPSNTAIDVSKTTCDDLNTARDRVREAYLQAVRDASKTYTDAHQEFSNGLNECLRGIWTGGPCDNEWKGTQQAYEKAWGDISNDEAYNNWKKAKKDWDECFKNYDQKQKDWSENNQKKEKTCQEEFQAKVDAARQAYENTAQAAKAKRDADLATLDAIEKQCKEKPAGELPPKTGGTTPPGNPGTPPTRPGIPTTPTTVSRSACTPAPAGIPGSQGTPRTGRASDFGPKDIAINLIVQVAEDVTGTPLPTGAIDNQIFAGIVCAKLHSRISEMTIEESDAQLSNDRPTEIRLRKKLDQYRRALNVWCSIAQGRPALADVKKEAAQIGKMENGSCKTDAECGSPLCCSANTIATSRCIEGVCVNQVNNCGAREVCMGPDASQPLFDHCGPSHEGNWTYGGSKPANWVFPQPGVPRIAPQVQMQVETKAHLEIKIGR